MKKLKVLILILVAGTFLMAGMQSCSKQPVACFTTSISADSIHVHDTVVFDARCSVFASGYNWQFYDSPDSIAFTPTVTKIFNDTGTVNVYLLVTDGNKYAGETQNIKIQP